MHEFAMCESLLKTLAAEYDRFLAEKKPAHAPRVKRVGLAVGDLHQLVPESLRLAWEALTGETAFAGSELALKKIPLAIRCRACAWEGEIKPPFFVCARCGKGDVETVAGNELYIEDMELADDEP